MVAQLDEDSPLEEFREEWQVGDRPITVRLFRVESGFFENGADNGVL